MNKEKIYYVYIITNRHNTVLYIGVTNNLERRLLQHAAKDNNVSFTALYQVSKLVYYERYGNIRMAIQREKRLKKWNRKWKVILIEKFNPEWKDLLFQAEYSD